MKKGIKVALFATVALGIIGVNTGKNMQNLSVFAQDNKSEYTAQTDIKTLASNEKSDIHLQIRAKSSYLMDYGSGTEIYAHNETTHLPIASMCKIMTLILCFDAIDEGNLDLEDTVRVSEKASSMGGSQVFLEANADYPVKELMKSIVVCSANDSCVAMAERIAGSEELFVARMNERAKSLGANDTLFANCTGLPKDPQYSCAKDVALMLRELLTHEKYYEFGKVWMDKFQHPKGRYTEITNTNKLVRFYEGCDGGKTGFTSQAGFCLAATAKRKDMRVISVVIGEENSANRFEDVKTMFNYAFANYSVTPIVQANVPLEETIAVNSGKVKTVTVCPSRSAYAFAKRGEKSNITMETVFHTLRAPIEKGERVGELVVYKDNVEVDRIPLIAFERVEKASFLDCLKDVAKNWCARK